MVQSKKLLGVIVLGAMLALVGCGDGDTVTGGGDPIGHDLVFVTAEGWAWVTTDVPMPGDGRAAFIFRADGAFSNLYEIETGTWTNVYTGTWYTKGNSVYMIDNNGDTLSGTYTISGNTATVTSDVYGTQTFTKMQIDDSDGDDVIDRDLEFVTAEGWAWVTNDVPMPGDGRAAFIFRADGAFSNLYEIETGTWMNVYTGTWYTKGNSIYMIDGSGDTLVGTYTVSGDISTVTSDVYGTQTFTKMQIDDSDEGDGNGGGGDNNDTYTGRTVTIGDLTWMAENLNRNTSNSWCYDDDPANCAIYGRLYTWDAAMSACPAGWRLPTRQQWDNLDTFVGTNAGNKLKSEAPDWNGTDDFGFSALPSGNRSGSSIFGSVGTGAFLWSATETDATTAFYRYMSSGGSTVMDNYHDKTNGFSVRCVR